MKVEDTVTVREKVDNFRDLPFFIFLCPDHSLTCYLVNKHFKITLEALYGFEYGRHKGAGFEMNEFQNIVRLYFVK